MIAALLYALLGVAGYAAVAILIGNFVGIVALFRKPDLEAQDLLLASVLWPIVVVAIGVILFERASERIQRLRPYFQR